MRKAIFVKFIQVILAALILNSVIFYIVTSGILLENAKRDMYYALESIDSVLDYNGGLKEEAVRLQPAAHVNDSRFTVIGSDGSVLADTDANASSMDNHLEREEIADAFQKGKGYSTRYSSTVGKTMLYTAIFSEHENCVLRLAVPYSGLREYLVTMLPAVWLSFLAALLFSAFSADRFSESVTRPLKEISQEMTRADGDYGELFFDEYQYPEINVIAGTTAQMSRNVKDYLNRIEKEKQIRQEFFSNASHELKTPITSIQGYAELLETGMVKDEKQKEEFIRRIKKEASNMAALINDILMISSLESRDAGVHISDVRLFPILQDVTESLKPAADAEGIAIHVDCGPVTVRADAQQMRELFNNLLSNAVMYNKTGGEVWVHVGQTESFTEIVVKDSGVGIPKEEQGRIFERFYRADKGRSRKQGGTGLGLSIVKHIVNYCGGSVSVSSVPGEGTEFTVKIPISEKM